MFNKLRGFFSSEESSDQTQSSQDENTAQSEPPANTDLKCANCGVEISKGESKCKFCLVRSDERYEVEGLGGSLVLEEHIPFSDVEEPLMNYLAWAFLYGGRRSFVVLHEDSDRHYLTQFALGRNSDEIHGEVTGNYPNLDKKYRLTRKQADELLSRGWREIRHENFFRKWPGTKNEEQLHKVMETGIRALSEVHGVSPIQEMKLILNLDPVVEEVRERIRRMNDEMIIELERAREAVPDNEEAVPEGSGLVYIMVNQSYGAEMLKIGMTARDADERARELSGSTGVASEFIVAYEAEVSDCYQAEQEIHRRLSEYRVSSNREFFRLPLKDAVDCVNEVVNEINGR